MIVCKRALDPKPLMVFHQRCQLCTSQLSNLSPVYETLWGALPSPASSVEVRRTCCKEESVGTSWEHGRDTFSPASRLFQDPTRQTQLIWRQLRHSWCRLEQRGCCRQPGSCGSAASLPWLSGKPGQRAQRPGSAEQWSLLQSQQQIRCFHLLFHPVAAETESFSSSELNCISHPGLYSCGRQVWICCATERRTAGSKVIIRPTSSAPQVSGPGGHWEWASSEQHWKRQKEWVSCLKFETWWVCSASTLALLCAEIKQGRERLGMGLCSSQVWVSSSWWGVNAAVIYTWSYSCLGTAGSEP